MARAVRDPWRRTVNTRIPSALTLASGASRTIQDLGASRAMPMCFSIPLRAEVLLLGRMELRL
jgi:hypothetical protein